MSVYVSSDYSSGYIELDGAGNVEQINTRLSRSPYVPVWRGIYRRDTIARGVEAS